MEENLLLFDNPTWRWDYVTALVDENRSPSRDESERVFRNGYRYFKRFKTSTRVDLYSLKKDYPILFAAHSLFLNPNSERWLIEAGLLTDLPELSLADYVAQPLAVVEMYRDMFFDVKDKLNSRGFILNRVLMPAYRRGVHEADKDLMFKTFAYCFGWDMFVEFIDKRKMSDRAKGFFNDVFKDQMLKLGVAATQKIEINNFNATNIMELNIKMMELDKLAHIGGNEAQASILLKGVIDSCKVNVLSSKVPVALNEPRSSEMLGVSKLLEYGEKIPVGV